MGIIVILLFAIAIWCFFPAIMVGLVALWIAIAHFFGKDY